MATFDNAVKAVDEVHAFNKSLSQVFRAKLRLQEKVTKALALLKDHPDSTSAMRALKSYSEIELQFYDTVKQYFTKNPKQFEAIISFNDVDINDMAQSIVHAKQIKGRFVETRQQSRREKIKRLLKSSVTLAKTITNAIGSYIDRLDHIHDRITERLVLLTQLDQEHNIEKKKHIVDDIVENIERENQIHNHILATLKVLPEWQRKVEELADLFYAHHEQSISFVESKEPSTLQIKPKNTGMKKASSLTTTLSLLCHLCADINRRHSSLQIVRTKGELLLGATK